MEIPSSPTAFSEATLPSPTQEHFNHTVDNLAAPLFMHAKASLNALSAAFDGLHGQTMQIANGSIGGKKAINDLRRDIDKQQLRHHEGIAEIQMIIDDLFDKEILGQLREQIEKEILLQIDEIVQEQVSACLQSHITKELKDEVEENKLELERARLALHNSESRRMNGKLQTEKPNEPLDTLLMPNGCVSAHFPKDLSALFKLDDKTCLALISDYEIPDVAAKRDKNLNKIMQHCGVRYQLVRGENA